MATTAATTLRGGRQALSFLKENWKLCRRCIPERACVLDDAWQKRGFILGLTPLATVRSASSAVSVECTSFPPRPYYQRGDQVGTADIATPRTTPRPTRAAHPLAIPDLEQTRAPSRPLLARKCSSPREEKPRSTTRPSTSGSPLKLRSRPRQRKATSRARMPRTTSRSGTPRATSRSRTPRATSRSRTRTPRASSRSPADTLLQYYAVDWDSFEVQQYPIHDNMKQYVEALRSSARFRMTGGVLLEHDLAWDRGSDSTPETMRRYYFLQSQDVITKDPPLPSKSERILFWSHATDVGAL